MKISAILTFLLSWSFVSSNPHHEKSDDKSAGELNYANEHESKNLNPNEASSGKDWGGIILNDFSQKGLDDVHKNDKDLSNNDNNGNIITRIPKILTERFMNRDHEHAGPASETKECAFTDVKTEKHGVRPKRDSKTSGLLWGDPRRGGISEHILKLSEGSTSNVLKSEKATVAEALNGRAAIQKILARAKAKAAKAARHKILYDNENDFSKWLMSGTSFDMDIFNRPFHRPSYDVKLAEPSEIESTDDSRDSAPLYRVSTWPIRHHRGRKRTFNVPFDSAQFDTADTERSYRRLLHRSKHREPELWITSGEMRGRGTDEIFREPTRRTHGSLFYEENDEPRRAFSRAHPPRIRHRVAKGETAGSDMPIWRHAESRDADMYGAHASHRLRAAEPHGFETSGEREEYDKEFAFRTRFNAGLDEREDMDDEWIRAGHRMRIHGGRKHSPDDVGTIADSRENAVLPRKRYHYDDWGQERSVYDEADAIAFDNAKNRHFTDFADERASSFDPYHEEDIRNRNKHYSHDGVQRSIIYSRSAEAGVEGGEKDQLGDMLITGVSTDTREAANSDMEHYHSRDQNSPADAATSSSSSLSEEKASKRTNNAHASLSVDDGSAAVGGKAENDVRERSRTVINNDATSAEIEMGFDGIKSHPPSDSPSDHSTPPRARPEIHQEDREVHRTIDGYHHSITDTTTSSKMEHSTDGGEDERSEHTNMQKSTSTEEHDDFNDWDAKENEEVSGNIAETSGETTNSFRSEHRYDLPRISYRGRSSDDLQNRGYTGSRKRHRDLKGSRRSTARHKTSIEVIDIGDRSAEVYIREFPLYVSGKKRAPHDINYDFDSEEMRDEREDWLDESVEDPRKGETDYDGLEKDDEFVDNEMSEKSLMTISGERRSHGQRGQHRKRGKYDRRKHQRKYTRHNKYDHRAFNQHARNMTSSNAWNASGFKTWDEYIYFIRQQRKHNESNASSFESFAFAGREDGRKNNATNEENLSLDERRKIYTTDDNYMHERYKKLPVRGNKRIKVKNASELVQGAHSTETDGETKENDRSIEGYWEGELENENDTSNQRRNRTRVKHTESLVYDDSTVDATSRASSGKSTINNGDRREQDSSDSSLGSSHASVRTKSVHDVHGENENVDITAKQTVGTLESTDSKSNLQHTSSTKTFSTSRSYTESQTDSEHHAKSRHSKEIVTKTQESDEKVSTDGEKKGYCDDESHKPSMSSKSIDESQVEMKNDKWKKSRSGYGISANVETLIETASSTDTIDKSRFAAQNAIASSESSAKSQSGKSERCSNNSNKKYNAKAEASADATVNNREESVNSANSLSSSKSIANKSERMEIDIEDHSNDSRNTQTDTVSLKAASSKSRQRHQTSATSVESSAQSVVENEQRSKDLRSVRLSTDAEISSTAAASSKVKNEQFTSFPNLSEESRMKANLNSYGDNQVNAISQSSATERFSNTMKNEHRSHTQRSFSSSSSESSKKQQAESQRDSNNLRNSQWNVVSVESAIKSKFNSAEGGSWFDPSKSSSSSKSSEETYAKNKDNIDNSIETQTSNIECRSELESASSSKSRAKLRAGSKKHVSVTEDNKRNIVNSEATSSVQAKNEHRSKLQDASLASESFTKSRAKGEHYSNNGRINRKKSIDLTSEAKATSTGIVKNNRWQESTSSSSLSHTSMKSQRENKNAKATMLNAISSTIVNDINDKRRYNMPLGLSSSQITGKNIINDRKIDTRTIANAATFTTSTDIHDENDILDAKWFTDPVSKNEAEKLTNNKITKKGKMSKEDPLSAASASTEAATSVDIKNKQDLTMSSSIDSKAETAIHDVNQQKEEETIIDNLATSRISATSEASNAIEDVDEGESLKISSLSDSRSTLEKRKTHDVGIIQNNEESMTTTKTVGSIVLNSNESHDNLAKGTTEALKKAQQRQNDFNVSKEKSEDATSGTTMKTTSSRVSSVHRDNMDTSSTASHEQIQIDDKLTDKNRVNVGNSIESSESTILWNIKHKRKNGSRKSKSSYNSHEHTKNEVNTGTRIKSLENTNNVNEMVSMKSADFNELNSDNQNDPLKVTSSDNSHTETSQKNRYKSDILSYGDETAGTRVTFHDGKKKRGSISRNIIFLNDSRDEAHIKHEDNYDISNDLTAVGGEKNSEEDNVRQITNELRRRNKIINTEIRNNINKWQKEVRKTSSSSSYGESQNEKENAIETEVSNNINKCEHESDPVRERSLIASSTNVHAGKENNYDDQRADVGNIAKARTLEARILNTNISPDEYRYDTNEEASAASWLKQYDQSSQKEDKLITSTTSSIDETNSGERRQHLSGTVASFNSYTEVQHENISNDLKENSEVTSSVATSMQTTSSGKVKHGSQEKFTGDPSRSNSYLKLETGNQDNVNILQEEQIVANGETSADSAVSNNFKHTLRYDSTKRNSLSHSSRDTYAENASRNVLKNNLANDVDIIASVKGTNYDDSKDKYQSELIMTASLSNSHAGAQAEHECNSNIQQGSMETTSSSMKDRTIEGRNIINNVGASSKIASNAVASAQAESSSNIENMIKQDTSKTLSSVDSYTESRTDYRYSLNTVQNSQEATDTQASVTSSASASADNQEERRNNFISHSDSDSRKMNKIENDDAVSKINVHSAEDISGQTTGFNKIEIGHRDNLLKIITSVDPVMNTQTRNEANIIQKQHSVATDSMDGSATESSDRSRIVYYADGNHKSNLNELIAASSNSHTMSGVESERRVNILEKDRTNVLSASTSAQTMISSGSKDVEGNESLRTTLSSGSYAGIEAKDESANNVKEDPSAVVKEETTSSIDINSMNRHILFDLPAGATKMQTKDKKISREDAIKKDLTEVSSDLSSAALESAYDSRISTGNYEDSASVDTIARTESSARRDQRKDSHGIITLSDSDRNGQRDSIESTSSAHSYVAARTTASARIAKSEKTEEDREATVSTIGKAEAYNEVKGSHPSDWLVTTSGGTATLAEERARNKDEFNILREVGEVAVYAGTSTGAAAADKIGNEQHDIRAEDPSDERRDSPDAAKKLRDAAISRASNRIIASKEAKNRRSGKNILDDETGTSLYGKERAEVQVQNEVGRGISRSSKSSSDIKEIRKSIVSAVSSASASTADNTIIGIGTKYDKINDETLAVSTLDPASKEVHLSSAETTSLHPSDKIGKCNNDVETREFISEASSLYHMLNKQRDSEILLMKKNPEGPVRVASLKNSVPPLIAYRLIPREVYERIRTIIANKQIRIADCPLSNT